MRGFVPRSGIVRTRCDSCSSQEAVHSDCVFLDNLLPVALIGSKRSYRNVVGTRLKWVHLITAGGRDRKMLHYTLPTGLLMKRRSLFHTETGFVCISWDDCSQREQGTVGLSSFSAFCL